MAVSLDGQRLFGSEPAEISVGQLRRQFVERAVAQLEGLVSIDLGLRGRKIRQRGLLRATSRQQLAQQVAAIEAFVDGKEHVLVCDDGQVFERVRVDTFAYGQVRTDGRGVVAEYEIEYTQLRVEA